MDEASPKDSSISPEERNRAALALASAIGRARQQYSIRDTLKQDARINAQQRLDILRRRLQPIFEAIPRDVEQFDLGVVTAEKPRLYIDIIGYVEITSDRKGYRLVQETRKGAQILGESNDESGITVMITDYIARRLVDRERALAGASLPSEPVPAAARNITGTAQESERSQDKAAQHIQNEIPAAPDTQAEAAAVPSPSILKPESELAQTLKRAPFTATATTQVSQSLADKAAAWTAQPAASPLPAAPAETYAHQQPDHGMRPAHEGHAHPTGMNAASQGGQGAMGEYSPHPMHQPNYAPHMGTTGQQRKRWSAPSIAATATGAASAAAAGVWMGTRSAGSSWWVWPVLSLLIGIGLGALLLYLYAASLAKS